MDMLKEDPIPWLQASNQPWVRYRTMVDLLDRPIDDAEVVAARQTMCDHPQVRQLIAQASDWPGHVLKRHNDAKLPMHKLTVLADFGLRHNDPGMSNLIEKVIAHQSSEGAFETWMIIPKVFGGNNKETWSWMLCDAPILLYALIGFGMGDQPPVMRALDHLISLIQENGWPCASSSELGKIQGPGRKDDPCPYANLASLKVLSLHPNGHQEAAHRGAEMLLSHWENQKARKICMFGIGTDFRKLKYPFIWYDILHMVDTLSHFTFVHPDPRFQEMVQTIVDQQDDNGRFTAKSVWMAFKDWDFGQKREPSPWITLLVARILKRIAT